MSLSVNEIHFVMGKGGVGKSTISLLLARYFEQQNQSSIIVECNGAQDIPSFYQSESLGYEIQKLTPFISSVSITAEEASEEYLHKQLPFKKLYQLIFKNKLVEPLLQGAPGLHNAVHLGKIYDLAGLTKNKQHIFDHIIVDCPATGHGLQLLSAAQTMMNLTKFGPLYESNRIVEERLQQRASLVIVTLPEELPCLETKELWKQLGENWRLKTKLFFINKNDDDDELRQQSIPKYLQENFPAHHKQLLEWQEEQQEKQKWQQWLKQELPLPHVNIPQKTVSQIRLSDDFQSAWSIKS